jgi:hypothetical protein
MQVTEISTRRHLRGFNLVEVYIFKFACMKTNETFVRKYNLTLEPYRTLLCINKKGEL